MKAAIEYGIQEIKMMPANTDGSFPDFDSPAGARLINLIVVGSFQEDREADQETSLYVEDLDEPVTTIVERRGKRTITFQTYDLSQDQYAYFMGYTFDGTYMIETSGFTLPPQAMRLITKSIGGYQAKVREWARLDVRVKKTGTIGKNGLPYLQLDMKFLINRNGSVVLPGYRERLVDFIPTPPEVSDAVFNDGYLRPNTYLRTYSRLLIK